MELEFESAPRVITRRTIVVRSITRLAVFILKLLYAGCVTFCRWHTPVCAAVVVSLSIGGGGHGVTSLPLRSQQAAPLPMWRPAQRVDARRYVKDQAKSFEPMHGSLGMGFEPSDGIRKENTVLCKFVTLKSPSRITSIPMRMSQSSKSPSLTRNALTSILFGNIRSRR